MTVGVLVAVDVCVGVGVKEGAHVGVSVGGDEAAMLTLRKALLAQVALPDVNVAGQPLMRKLIVSPLFAPSSGPVSGSSA